MSMALFVSKEMVRHVIVLLAYVGTSTFPSILKCAKHYRQSFPQVKFERRHSVKRPQSVCFRYVCLFNLFLFVSSCTY